MALSFTYDAFPSGPSTAYRCALPWGAVAQPLFKYESKSSDDSLESLSSVPRCKSCAAYISPFAQFPPPEAKPQASATSVSHPPQGGEYTQTDRNATPQLDANADVDEVQVQPLLGDHLQAPVAPTSRNALPSSSSPQPTRLPEVEYDSPAWWQCALCQRANVEEDENALARYASPEERKLLPELSSLCSDFVIDRAYVPRGIESSPGIKFLRIPCYIIAIDLSRGGDYLDLVKNSVLAVLEALPPSTLVGLCTFSDRIGLYNLHASKPPAVRKANGTDADQSHIPTPSVHVSYTLIPLDGESASSVPLAKVLSIREFLVHVGEFKDAIADVVESLEPRAASLPRLNRTELARRRQQNFYAPPPPEEASADMQAPPSADADADAPLLADADADAALESAVLPPTSGNGEPNGVSSSVAGHQSFTPAVDPEFQAPNSAHSASGAPVHSQQTSSHAAHFVDDEPEIGNGFGSFVTELISYVSSSTEELTARVLTFLSGCPNFGMGALSSSRIEHASSPEGLMCSATQHYIEQGRLASDNAICFDLFCVSGSTYFDLATLKALSIMTGGNILRYEDPITASLPQDLYRQLSSRQVFDCIFRTRTSPEFEVESTHGHFPGPSSSSSKSGYTSNASEVFSLAGCDPSTIVSMSFQFTSEQGFRDIEQPMIQLAFAYTETSEEVGPDGRPLLVAERKLRIVNAVASIAPTYAALYKSAHVENIVAHLTRKAIVFMETRSIGDGRQYIERFLQRLQVAFTKTQLDFDPRSGAPPRIPPRLNESEALQFLPRFCYALLKSPMLIDDISVHPDVRVYLRCLYSALATRQLSKALYPSLSAFNTCNDRSRPALFLSTEEVNLLSAEIYLLDAFDSIFVFYSNEKTTEQFPPPLDSVLRKEISVLHRQPSLISPRLVFTRKGDSNSALFWAQLIEDTDRQGFGWDEFEAAIEAAASSGDPSRSPVSAT